MGFKRTKKQYEDDIVDVIKKNKIMFVSHIFGFYPFLEKSQFYKLKLQDSPKIMNAIANNKSTATGFMINKWIGSDNATLQIAAYKLLCSDEEREKLAKGYNEISGPNGTDIIPKINIEIVDKTSVNNGNE